MANKFDLIKDSVVRRVVEYLYNKYELNYILEECLTAYDIITFLSGKKTLIPDVIDDIRYRICDSSTAAFTLSELDEIRRIYPEIFTAKAHKKFEYMLLEIDSVFIYECLHDQGELGWELCTIYNNQLIFKREVI